MKREANTPVLSECSRCNSQHLARRVADREAIRVSQNGWADAAGLDRLRQSHLGAESSASTSQRDSGRGCPSRREVRGVLGGPSRPHPGRPSGPAGPSRPYCSLRGRRPRQRHQGALGVLGGPGRLADRRWCPRQPRQGHRGALSRRARLGFLPVLEGPWLLWGGEGSRVRVWVLGTNMKHPFKRRTSIRKLFVRTHYTYILVLYTNKSSKQQICVCYWL